MSAALMLFACFLVWETCVPPRAEARVTHIEIDRIESPTFAGRAFGAVGQYEKIVGRAFGAVDPEAAENAGIVNLDLAATDSAGRVAYSTDFVILRPRDPTKGNHTLFYGVPNRGNTIDLVLLNDVPYGPPTKKGNDDDHSIEKRSSFPFTAADAGNGFLMRHGYTLVWSGWQARGKAGAQCCVPDTPEVMGADLPVALENGRPLSGPVRDLFVGRQQTEPQTASLSYPVLTPDPRLMQLSVRARARGEQPQPIPACTQSGQAERCWRFVDEQTVHLHPGFESGLLYEFAYTGKNPPVLGLGFGVTRDVVSFLRYETADERGTANPLRLNAHDTGIHKALAFGISQAGRYLQEHVWAGFNQDEHKRIVFDGLIADIGGAGKTFSNFPFGQPGRTQGGHRDFGFAENWFPFAYGKQHDPLTGKQDGILRAGSGKPGDGFDPLIMVTNTASEYWRKSASLLHTDSHGNDMPTPDTVRLYFFASSQHFALHPTPITASLGRRLAKGPCTQEHNPAFRGPVMRALVLALHRWVYDGASPPASRIPTRQAGTLVSAQDSAAGFPSIPGAIHIGDLNPTLVTHTAGDQTRYTSLVPKTDADGNDLAGIRLPDIAAPLGTATGWALRADVPGAMCGNWGQFIPFARTKAEREASGDPRLSLAERYPSRAAYVDAIRRSVAALQDQGLLLADDAAAYIADAERTAPIPD